MVVWDLNKDCCDDSRDDPIYDPNSTAIGSEIFPILRTKCTPCIHLFFPFAGGRWNGFHYERGNTDLSLHFNWMVWCFLYDLVLRIVCFVIHVSYTWHRFIAFFDFKKDRWSHTTLFLGRWASSMMSLSNIGIPSWNQVNRTIQATDFEKSALDESPTSFRILRDRVVEVGDMWKC